MNTVTETVRYRLELALSLLPKRVIDFMDWHFNGTWSEASFYKFARKARRKHRA